MPRLVLTADERKERRRLCEQRRKERIKNDPILREEFLRKDRERYARRKAAGLIIPRSALNRHRLRNLRQKNLASAKAYYKKKKSLVPNINVHLESAGTSNTQPNDESAEPPEIVPEENGLALRSRRSLRSESRCQDRRISALVADRSANLFTSSPQETPPGSPLLAPNYSSINSPDATLCPCSPASDSSIATMEFQRGLQQRFRRYKQSKSRQLTALQTELAQVSRERNMYKKRYYRLIQKAKEKVPAGIKERKAREKLITAKPSQDRNRQIVVKFYEDDENSSLCPGKNDTVTRNGIKKQKRLMTDTIKNLHKKYINSGYPPISYVTFSRMKPFWVQQPNVNMRNTCLCEKHENMDLLISALKTNRIIKENTISDVLKSICCDIFNFKCLQRTCSLCKNKYLIYQEFNNSENVSYWAWEKKKNTYSKNGIDKTAITVEKVRHYVKPIELIKKYETNLKPFLNHCANIRNQSDAIKTLKKNMTENDCIIHIDFSENYSVKYSSEIKSVHFGGSRKQFTLHTAVLYFNINNQMTKTQCFCTISTSLRHDAAAVWAHLVPILREIEHTMPMTRNLYIVSDSPSAQYRNKKIFYIISQLASYIPTLNNIVWNYCECGHGKGAPDGVGGLLKRTADRFVALSGDIPNINALVNALKSSVQGVKIDTVEDYEVTEKDWLLPDNLKAFPGTMQVHQVVWTKESRNRLALRNLSCTYVECLNNVNECPHGKHLGFYNLPTNPESIPPLEYININPLTSRTVKSANHTKTNIISSMRPVKLKDKLSLLPRPSTSALKPNSSPILSPFENIEEKNLPLNLDDSDIPSCSFLEKLDSKILKDLEKSDSLTLKNNIPITKPDILGSSDSDESIFHVKTKKKFTFLTKSDTRDEDIFTLKQKKKHTYFPQSDYEVTDDDLC